MYVLQLATDPTVVQWSVCISMAALACGLIRVEFCEKKRKGSKMTTKQKDKLDTNRADIALKPKAKRYYCFRELGKIILARNIALWF